jgi:phosphoserine phosphatase RsbX
VSHSIVGPARPAERAHGVRPAHLSMPKSGEYANGDRAFVRQEPSGRTLLGIVDALGHGPEAERVALVALDELSTVSLDTGIGDVMERVHRRLRGTRGAAATLCLVDRGEIQACGVGDVEFRCQENSVPFVLSPGVLGGHVRTFRVCRARLEAPSRLLFFSDGVTSRVRPDDLRMLAPLEACRRVLQDHRRTYDDATVLIADVD